MRIWLGGNRGKVMKWSSVEKGTEFTGVFRGLREGLYGWLADLETAQGTRTLPVPLVLERQLARVRPGAEVTIKYDGMVSNTKSGRDFHSFNVAVEETDVKPESTRMAAPADANSEEVPF